MLGFSKNSSFFKGFTLVETLVVSILLLLLISSSIYWFTGSARQSSLLERNSFFEDSWQRSMLWLRKDLRAAESIEVEAGMLNFSYAELLQADQSVVVSKVSFYLNKDGEFCRRESNGTEKRISLTPNDKNLKTSLAFKQLASESVEISLKIEDTSKGKVLLTRSVVINSDSGSQNGMK